MTDTTCYDKEELEAVNKRALINYISKTPELLSLLYNINLMPKQVLNNTYMSNKMLAIASAWNQKEVDFNLALMLVINRTLDKTAVAIQKLPIDECYSDPFINGYIECKCDAAKAVQELKNEQL